MRKTILVMTLILAATTAHAATAYFTGRSQYVQTVTGKGGISCEYNAYGNVFWRTFVGTSCPMNIEVQ